MSERGEFIPAIGGEGIVGRGGEKESEEEPKSHPDFVVIPDDVKHQEQTNRYIGMSREQLMEAKDNIQEILTRLEKKIREIQNVAALVRSKESQEEFGMLIMQKTSYLRDQERVEAALSSLEKENLSV